MERIFTGDKTWIHHYEPETKRHSMEWKHPQSPTRKKFKTQSLPENVMLMVFLGFSSTKVLSGRDVNCKQCSV